MRSKKKSEVNEEEYFKQEQEELSATYCLIEPPIQYGLDEIFNLAQTCQDQEVVTSS
jgi:hypothetical protein